MVSFVSEANLNISNNKIYNKKDITMKILFSLTVYPLIPFIYGLVYFLPFTHLLTTHQIMGLVTLQIGIVGIWMLMLFIFPILKTRFMYYMMLQSIVISFIVGLMDLFQLKKLYNGPIFLLNAIILWSISFLIALVIYETCLLLKKKYERI